MSQYSLEFSDTETNFFIPNILFTLDKTFTSVNFGIEEVIFGNSKKYCILVDDLDFYLNDKKFQKYKSILRKKYPKEKWFCAYRKII